MNAVDPVAPDDPVRATALVVGGSHDVRERIARATAEATSGRLGVDQTDSVIRAADIAAAVQSDGGIVPLAVVVFGDDASAGELDVDGVVALHSAPPLARTRIVLVTRSATLRGADRALRSGAVNGMISQPWTADGMAKLVVAQLATFLVEHSPDHLGQFDGLLDDDDRERARRRIELRRGAPGPVAAEETERAHPLLDQSSEDAELEAQLVELLDRALGHPPRIRVAPGTVLIESGEDVGGIYVLLDGAVRLSSTTASGEQILHEQSTGSILGLLSLASKRRAMLQCRAVTDVLAIPVTLDQLAHALDAEPELSGLLNRVLIGSLARRLRRSDELQVELDQSLAALSEARAELVSTARLATLGELSAGLAHELNNPAAALVRSIDHLAAALTADGLLADDVVRLVRERMAATVPSTSDVRAWRREITAAVGDRRLADRLVAMGITEPAVARRVARASAEELARREAAARLGGWLRDAGAAARRVQALVGSLRAYARGEDGGGPRVPDVDVARTIRSALTLLSHRVGSTSVELDLRDVPTIVGQPGPLQAVWNNLLSNALDALGDRAPDAGGPGRLLVELDHPDPAHVRVRVTDDGPGVPPALLDRIFEPRFTTKGGRVRFGLGLGLSITRQIVHEHGGTIEVESRPGRTVFTVLLPTQEPS